jgi:hypothetical protein
MGFVRATLAFVAAALAVLVFLHPGFSAAVFTSHSGNTGNAIATDTPSNYLHLYSQATDPAKLGSYFVRGGTASTPAATGTDDSLAVDLGTTSFSSTDRRTFVVDVPATLPSATGGSVRVDLRLEADPATGVQPITGYGLTLTSDSFTLGATGATLAAGQRRQVNLTISTSAMTRGVTYKPRVDVAVTYTGYTGTFLVYSVPVTVKRA